MEGGRPELTALARRAERCCLWCREGKNAFEGKARVLSGGPGGTGTGGREEAVGDGVGNVSRTVYKDPECRERALIGQGRAALVKELQVTVTEV